MKVKKPDSPRKKKASQRSNSQYQFVIIGIVLFLALGFFFWHQIKFKQPTPSKPSPTDTAAQNISIPEQTPKIADIENQTSIPDPLPKGTETTTGRVENSDKTKITSSTGNDRKTPNEKQSLFEDSASLQGNSSVLSTETTPLDKICNDSTTVIKQFYAQLDTKEYMKVYGLKTSSEQHFTKLTQKLLDNPPIVSGETNDLFAILQNTAHFFRIIGKENILVIKAILDQEKDEFENVLAHFYSLLHIPDCPAKSFSLRIQGDSLYEYAGFFLSTMGGRLYLFRRDSMSRMVVSYYAILLVDKANKNASNHHGIEIQKAIDLLISEMESTVNTLQLHDKYLDKLYDLKEEYQ